MADILIYGGRIVTDGESFSGYIVVRGERIETVGRGAVPQSVADGFRGEKIDATGCVVIPGVIDDQVHFRQPGFPEKADIHSESVAGVAGGVTSFMEMPNTKPPTVTLEALEQKFETAAASSVANYSFYFGATNDNVALLGRLDPRTTCGVKLFMGSSTGNMLVDDERTLSAIFAESPLLIATHCEQESMIRESTAAFKARYGDNVTPAMHPLIRSAEACYRSSAQAVALADKYGSSLHVLHLSTAAELALFDSKPLKDKKITNEVCVHHLWFTDADYAAYGNRIKWNPAIKSTADRDALRQGILGGKVDVVATDHAPHTIAEKALPYWNCPSGGPLLQHSLVMMLEMVYKGVFTVEQVVDKMCHAPAVRFGVCERGFLREGAFADIAIVNLDSPWMVTPENLLYKCGWSPLEGMEFRSKVEYTIINGEISNRKGVINTNLRGRMLKFER